MSFLSVPREDRRTCLAPALQDSGTGQHGFQFSELMDRWLAARDRGKTQIGNFSGRPIGAVMYSSAKENAGADVGTYMDEGEVPDVLRGAAIVFALRGKIHIVFNNYEAACDLAEHGSQRNGAPAFESADRKHAALIHIGDGRHADHQRQQLVPASRVFAQKFLQLVANQAADRFRGGLPFYERNFSPIEFAAVQVG